MKQPKVVTFCNADYVKLAVPWVRNLERTGVRDYVVAATDEIAQAELTKQGVNTRLANGVFGTGQGFASTSRLNVIHQYLKDGVDVVHSDLDAIWKRNILPQLDDPGVDLYMSQGTMLPQEHFEKHGFVLCCGFYYAKSNERVVDFFTALLKFIDERRERSDQRALNLLLLDTEWQLDATEKRSAGHPRAAQKNIMLNWFEANVAGYNKAFNLRLSLISMSKVQRIRINQEGAVYHPFSGGKSLQRKIGCLATHDLIDFADFADTTLKARISFHIHILKWKEESRQILNKFRRILNKFKQILTRRSLIPR